MFDIKAGRLPSVMKHDFSRVPKAEIPRSKFNRSHGLKTTFDAGDLIPIFVDEALPGDTFNLKMTTFARMATPIVPIMDNMYCDTFFFAVPYRLLWDKFNNFMGEQLVPGVSVEYEMPSMVTVAGTCVEGTIFDYMGLPTKVSDVEFNTLPFRAYNKIWNEWFRDQNYQTRVTEIYEEGATETLGDYSILKRGKRHDYFTSCLPWPQKGDAVQLPLGDSAPVTGLGVYNQTFASVSQAVYETDGSATVTYANSKQISNAGVNNYVYVEQDPNNTGYPNIRANLAEATAATINELRQAFQLQKLLERDARGGTRYTEIIRSHFGVVSDDARLQRPEYLGGGSTQITFTPIPQTAITGTTPQGNLAAVGTFSHKGHGFTKSFTEHCVILGLASVRADLNYQQGLDRMWSRKSRYDLYWPALSHIGEQAVLNKEIYADGTSADEEVFGYQERYAEYRYKPSHVTGLFRSNATGSLDFWHLSQEFADTPVLNEDFIWENPPVDRVIAVPSQPQFLFDAYFDLVCARPMPVYSVPGLIDHF